MAKRPRKSPRPSEAVQKKPRGPGENLPGTSAAISWKPILQGLVIVVAAGWIYWPVLKGDWLWDDDHYITDNLLLHDLSGLTKIWFQPGSFLDYYPVTESVQWLQWHWWGLDTFGYHLTNLALHIVSALLVWRLLSKLGLRLAWLGGLIFAIHPVQVESVAWISELKNTLSLPPLLLAMCFYLDYEERKQSRDYGLALGLFLIAMLCKIVVVLFPLVILLHAWWKRDRIGWNDLKESAPFFVVSLLLGLVTIMSGIWSHLFNHLPTGFVPEGGLPGRLDLAGLSLAFYVSKVLLPVGLLPIYPKWTVDASSPLQFLPWLGLGVMIGWFWKKRRSWGRHALLGLGFFIINLAPSPGFIPAPNMGFAWVMDHFLYLPIIGLIGLTVAGWGHVEEKLSPRVRPFGVGVAAVIVACMAWESRLYAGVFINSETLWSYTLQGNPDSWLADNNLGYLFLEKGQMDEAMGRFQKALETYPDYPDAHNNLGKALLEKGQVDEAISQFQKVLEIDPYLAEGYNNLGNALLTKGAVDEAMPQFQKALEINPNYADAHYNLGTALLDKGQIDEAKVQFQTALEINLNDFKAHNNLGLILLQEGQVDEAIAQLQTALEINPSFATAHNNLANAFLEKGATDEAIVQYRETLEINPGLAATHSNLGCVLMQAGQITEAIEQFEQALRIDPHLASAERNLAKARAMAQQAHHSKVF